MIKRQAHVAPRRTACLNEKLGKAWPVAVIIDDVNVFPDEIYTATIFRRPPNDTEIQSSGQIKGSNLIILFNLGHEIIMGEELPPTQELNLTPQNPFIRDPVTKEKIRTGGDQIVKIVVHGRRF